MKFTTEDGLPRKLLGCQGFFSDLLGAIPGLGGGGGGGQGATGGGGFFGSGATSSQNETNTNTQNIQLNPTGNTVLGGGTITTTDYGAISRAADVSQAALDLGSASLDANSGVSIAGLDNAKSQLESSLSFASGITSNANTFAAGVASHAFDVSQSAFEGAIAAEQAAVSKAIDSNAQTTAAAISGNNALAAQVSQSSQQSVNDSVVKLAGIAAFAVAAIFIFRGMR